MSYAIETKKRKFERILGTLTDGNAHPPRTPSRPQTSKSTISIAESAEIDGSKRRRVTPSQVTQLPGSSATTSLSAHYLPTSRQAFLDRLESFRHVTKWHVPSTSKINAAEWAKRGWVCEGSDTVYCHSCKQRVLVDLEVSEQRARMGEQEKEDEQQRPEDSEIDSFSLLNAMYDGLIKRYEGMIITAHLEACAWRKRGCDVSIQKIEGLLNVSGAISGLKERYETISNRLDEIPSVASLPSTDIQSTDDSELERLDLADMNIDAIKLAVCGWQRKEIDVIECRHCFRSLGLWLYRGKEPTMEQLDAIDSHLEYCPWRSPEAQDTEITTSGRDPPKLKLPGWQLVYQAVIKDNSKRTGREHRNTAASAATDGSDDPQPDLTPEQREKKMKDLMKRIRDIKKPFNVKSLLRKKDKVQS